MYNKQMRTSGYKFILITKYICLVEFKGIALTFDLR